MWVVEIFTSKLVWEVQYDGADGDKALEITQDCIDEDYDTRMTLRHARVLN